MADEDPTQAAQDVKPEPGAAGEEPTHLNLKVKAQVWQPSELPTCGAPTWTCSSPSVFEVSHAKRSDCRSVSAGRKRSIFQGETHHAVQVRA